MKLSLSQAAEQLGKTRRQIRYMIQEGRLQARKDGGRWVVDSEALPLDDPQRAARARRQDRLREAADHALGPRPATRWGLRDLKAIGVGVPLYRRCLDLLGEDAAPTRELRAGLDLLAIGAHRYGSFDNPPDNLRSADRDDDRPDDRNDNLGLRCVRSRARQQAIAARCPAGPAGALPRIPARPFQ